MFTNLKFSESSMVALIAKRRLGAGEFHSWEARFKQRAETRKAAGCRGARYYHSLDNEGEVVMILHWETREQAQSFLDAMLAQFPDLESDPTALDYMIGTEFAPLDH